MSDEPAAVPRRDLLLRRLDGIAASLEQSGRALALLALGSVGRGLERVDDYSDLDFFAIVKEGGKREFVEDLSWLARVRPIVFSYRNTPDGHKALFSDGVFCEFAVFEPAELSGIPFAPGRIVWRDKGFDESVCEPRRGPSAGAADAGWLLGEALSDLYVGACRWRRGELLAAMRAIQLHAVEAVARLIAAGGEASPSARDPFANERRFEARFPSWGPELARAMQGYDRSRESALALLDLLESRFQPNPAMAAAIRGVCGDGPGRT